MDKYKQVKDKVRELSAKADRSQGAFDQLMQQLEDEFNCKSLAGAQKLLTEYEEQETKAQRQFDKQLREFEEDWGELLPTVEDEGGSDVRSTLRRRPGIGSREGQRQGRSNRKPRSR